MKRFSHPWIFAAALWLDCASGSSSASAAEVLNPRLTKGKNKRQARAAALALFGILSREGKAEAARGILQKHQPPSGDRSQPVEVRLLKTHCERLRAACPDGSELPEGDLVPSS